MNYGISVLFRFIPLLMALICFFFGGYIFGYGNDEARWVAGPVVFSLGVLCIALFATAATIIRRGEGKCIPAERWEGRKLSLLLWRQAIATALTTRIRKAVTTL